MIKKIKYPLLQIGLISALLNSCSSNQEFEESEYMREISSQPSQESIPLKIDLQAEKDEIIKEYEELVSEDTVRFSKSIDFLSGRNISRDEYEKMLYHLRRKIKARQTLVDLSPEQKGHKESLENYQRLERRIVQHQRIESAL